MKTNVLALSLLFSSTITTFTPATALMPSTTTVKRTVKATSHLIELWAGLMLAYLGVKEIFSDTNALGELMSFKRDAWKTYGIGTPVAAAFIYNGWRGFMHELEGHHHHPPTDIDKEECVIIMEQK